MLGAAWQLPFTESALGCNLRSFKIEKDTAGIIGALLSVLTTQKYAVSTVLFQYIINAMTIAILTLDEPHHLESCACGRHWEM